MGWRNTLQKEYEEAESAVKICFPMEKLQTISNNSLWVKEMEAFKLRYLAQWTLEVVCLYFPLKSNYLWGLFVF